MASSSSDLYLHYFYFQAFGDELDVRQSDFESVRSQGERLIGQLSDHTERESLTKQMDDISNRLERIQNLVSDRGREFDARDCGTAELNTAMNDCYDKVEQFKTSLREFKNLEMFGEGQERLQLQVGMSHIVVTLSSGGGFGSCGDFCKVRIHYTDVAICEIVRSA